MSKTPLVDKFIERYRRYAFYSADMALIILLEQHAESIEPLFEVRDPEWLHKAFRQTDVTDSGKSDMLIWHLIHAAPSFWEVLHDFWKLLDRREEKSRIRQVEEERDGLLAAQADHQRLVGELDVLLNGEAGAAKQASLCDIVAQVAKDGVVAKTQLHKLAATMENVIMAGTSGSRGMRNFLAEAKKALDEVKEVL